MSDAPPSLPSFQSPSSSSSLSSSSVSSSQSSSTSPSHPPPQAPALPTARLQPRREWSWIWLVPLLALGFAAWLGWRAWSQRGLPIVILLDQGHGLEVGDEVRYRGMAVGRVQALDLAPDLKHVQVHARLTEQGDRLARAGSRFWVVRPQVRLSGVEGLDTLIGPRYLAVLPPDAPDNSTQRGGHRAALPRAQRFFVGLSEPPIVETAQPGDLEILLLARQRGSLHPGAPITYRQTRIGSILSVGLASDAGAVEARAHIEQRFAPLIRPNTRFWDSGGLQATLGFSGVSIDIDSAEALLSGGVALATPPLSQAGGDIVRTGHRFRLAEKPEDDWLDWQPMVAIGSELLPPNAAPPSPLRARLGWEQGRWISRDKSRTGWVLQIEGGLLGPADLLQAGEKAEPGTVSLEVAGSVVPLQEPLQWDHEGLALRAAKVVDHSWPRQRMRAASEPEDCLLIGDSAATPLPLDSARLTRTDQGWVIDPAVAVDASWHGACVVSRRDGAIIGLLLVNDDEGSSRVATLQGLQGVSQDEVTPQP